MEVTRNVDTRDGHEPDNARILHILAEEGGDFYANRLGDPIGATVVARHTSEESGRGIDNPAQWIAVDEAIDRLEDGLGVTSLGGDDADGQLGGLPYVVTPRFGDGDVELVMQPVLQTLQHRPLV